MHSLHFILDISQVKLLKFHFFALNQPSQKGLFHHLIISFLRNKKEKFFPIFYKKILTLSRFYVIMLDESLLLSKKLTFFNTLLRKEVRAVPDVPWVHMDDPPDGEAVMFAGMPASVKTNILLTTLEKRK